MGFNILGLYYLYLCSLNHLLIMRRRKFDEVWLIEYWNIINLDLVSLSCY